MKFAEKIKILRKSKKLSQKALAKKIGVPYHTIVAIENDRSKVPLITTLLKFSSFFKVSVDKIIKDVEFDERAKK